VLFVECRWNEIGLRRLCLMAPSEDYLRFSPFCSRLPELSGQCQEWWLQVLLKGAFGERLKGKMKMTPNFPD
jgi:hypothetical protein